MNGLKGLLDSKKGTVLGAMSGVLGTMMAQGAVPIILGAKMLFGMACVHMVCQAFTDAFGGRKSA